MKETKGRRRKRIFAGMTLADLRLIKDNYKPGDKLIRGIKSEELTTEIARREKIAAGMVNQPRAGGRFAAKPHEYTCGLPFTCTATIFIRGKQRTCGHKSVIPPGVDEIACGKCGTVYKRAKVTDILAEIPERIGKGIKEGLRDIPAEELEKIHAAHETVTVKVCPKHGRGSQLGKHCSKCGAQFETHTVPGCCGLPWDIQDRFCIHCGSPRPIIFKKSIEWGPEDEGAAEAKEPIGTWLDAINLYKRLLKAEPSEQKCQYFAKAMARAIKEELTAKSRNKPSLLHRLKRWLL